MQVLWIHVGDGGEYHSYVSVAEAADYLSLAGVTPTLRSYVKYGLATNYYSGFNYISAYWGNPNDAGNPERELTNEEISQLNLAIVG